MKRLFGFVIDTGAYLFGVTGFFTSIFIVLRPWAILNQDYGGSNWNKYLTCVGSVWIIVQWYQGTERQKELVAAIRHYKEYDYKGKETEFINKIFKIFIRRGKWDYGGISAS